MRREDEDIGATYIWGTNITVEKVERRCGRFLREYRDPRAEEGTEPKYVHLLRQVIVLSVASAKFCSHASKSAAVAAPSYTTAPSVSGNLQCYVYLARLPGQPYLSLGIKP